MLDDLKYIHGLDVQDALGIVGKQWQQLGHQYDLEPINFTPENIVYSGMGGSALAALISTSWPGYSIPFQVVRDYEIPSYVSGKTLFIAASYSGNTEETLSALDKAEGNGAHIAVIAGGGKLLETATVKKYPYILLPKAEQPRYAVLYNLKAIVVLLEKTGILDEKTANDSLNNASTFLKTATEKWRPDVAAKDNPAKKIAFELVGKSIVVYSGPKLYPSAYKWKISFNENAKNVAWLNQYPEFNHNEMIGWTKQPVDKPYTIINLMSTFENPRINKRFEVATRLLSGMCPEPIIVNVEGENMLEQLVWAMAFGDFVSIYLALLNGVNPTPVSLVEKFKKALDE